MSLSLLFDWSRSTSRCCRSWCSPC